MVVAVLGGRPVDDPVGGLEKTEDPDRGAVIPVGAWEVKDDKTVDAVPVLGAVAV